MGVRISHVGINIGRSLESSESVNRSLKDIYIHLWGAWLLKEDIIASVAPSILCLLHRLLWPNAR